MEAKGLYTFDASHEDELSFRQGEVLKVRNMEDQGWYQAEFNGRKGFIPSTYVHMEPHDWYKGKMSRTGAEEFLMQTDSSGHHKFDDGAFIVRDCESDKNQFSLSVKHGSCPQHFKILSSSDGQYYLWPNKSYSSINKLIEEHRKVSIAREPHVKILLKNLNPKKTKQGKASLPPKPSSGAKQGQVRYRALYNFKKDLPEELCFNRGDIIELLEKTDENWWTGRVEGTAEQGLFPKNYVEVMTD